MVNLRVENRVENVEAQLKALDETIGNFLESYKGTEESISRNLRHIEESVQLLTEGANFNFDAEDGHTNTSLRAIAARLSTIEEQLSIIQDNTSIPSSFRGTSEVMPLDVVKQLDDEAAKHKIKELEIRLKKAEDERKQTQELYEETHADRELWKAEFDSATASHDELATLLQDQIDREKEINRNLFQKVQEMKGNIRVMCRIRPAPKHTPSEDLANFGPRQPGDFSNAWGKIRMGVERKNAMGFTVADQKAFDFERIFGPDETNNDIFNEISDLIECALEGQKVGIFAYGQTGSGKTYTLSHRDLEHGSSDGIIPRTLASIFETAGQKSHRYRYSISLSVLEIYTNNIYDLLKAPLDGNKTETRLEQATILPLDSLTMAEEIIEDAINIRTSSSTEKNENSSRSHLIITFHVLRENITDGTSVEGLLNLVDLAGSERSAADGLEGQQLQEGILINRSLLSLNRVITSLGQGAPVSFDTALTRALKPCLSHDSKALMFVMVSPFKRDLSVTLQTFEKGQEATNAKLASVNRSGSTTRNNAPKRLTLPATRGRGNGSPSPTGVRFPKSATRGRGATPTTPRRTAPNSKVSPPSSSKVTPSTSQGTTPATSRSSTPAIRGTIPATRGATPSARGTTPSARGNTPSSTRNASRGRGASVSETPTQRARGTRGGTLKPS
ncbi:P-loop containing nucleoside triphosphate hydrolase protein [Hypoxylon rubiginosum]|uniref:P-loop containing nucleoside triphosphate hydrolase protein n=1 Tax=Hypoxylon rubiginosum TaxID=110542 RepID=A0ACC0DBK6_9PEZI|nr:P-loop containing nucleoside triphosphate hydrolase protein [Hypoxylon rubiginosum]